MSDVKPAKVGGKLPMTPMAAAAAKSAGISLRTGRPKRKKASRACFHCQKAHLTCDDGLHATCQDGVRKKAKYLHDIEQGAPLGGGAALKSKKPGGEKKAEEVPLAAAPPARPPGAPAPVPAAAGPAVMPGTIDPSSIEGYDVDNNGLFSNFDVSNTDFGSRMANLEYSYLSNMIGTTGVDAPFAPSMDELARGSMDPAMGMAGSELAPGYFGNFPEMNVRDASWANRGLASVLSGTELSPHSTGSPPTPPVRGGQLGPLTLGGHGVGVVHGGVGRALPRRRDTESVYAAVTEPFSYTPGYHGLISYLKSRFDRAHLMRVARSMAAFRPSFIACTKTLKNEDLIFMEKCFQRTLLEYEKFISYSGTPTLVWRRTAQVAAVGKEFCILTGWTKEQLLGKCTFVVELMDDASVVEYFEDFSRIAFGDSRAATMMECTLLSPTGRKIPTACTWTIKRDMFDIPMMIVGNFLPILS
ncbi:uncharacterized protein V1510DRAFT_429781 [Dipodascopsis tothii]|uniref:uncharacterized protein n=1 Tax=Dipodascopsis tothii TaxID=44089 RepID=UPI0034CF3C1C